MFTALLFIFNAAKEGGGRRYRAQLVHRIPLILFEFS